MAGCALAAGRRPVFEGVFLQPVEKLPVTVATELVGGAQQQPLVAGSVTPVTVEALLAGERLVPVAARKFVLRVTFAAVSGRNGSRGRNTGQQKKGQKAE